MIEVSSAGCGDRFRTCDPVVMDVGGGWSRNCGISSASVQLPDERLRRGPPLPPLAWAGAVSIETTRSGSTILVVSSSDTTTTRRFPTATKSGCGTCRDRSCGDRIRTCDLEVMSLASYRTAPPRVRGKREGSDRSGHQGGTALAGQCRVAHGDPGLAGPVVLGSRGRQAGGIEVVYSDDWASS
jgi:hypothetical protein